jgi:hypothetical protein
LLTLALAAACGGTAQDPGPLNRFFFPTAVEVRDHKLLVVSSNFDLTYDRDDGGTVLSVDPAASTAAGVPQYSLVRNGAARISSFGGQLAFAGPECGFADTRALVASRVANTLYRIKMDASGVLTCDVQDCPLPLRTDSGIGDPYSVGLSCRGQGNENQAWIGYLRGPTTTGWLVQVDLATGAQRFVDVPSAAPSGEPRAFAYDATADRLFYSVSGTYLTAPLRWIELAGNCAVDLPEAEGGCPQGQLDLFPLVRGADFASIAISNDVTVADPTAPGGQRHLPRRIYAAVKLYSVEVATTLGARPGFDVGGVLVVFELSDGPQGPLFRMVGQPHDIGLGVQEVKVLPARAGQRDVVVISAMDAGRVAIWDDDQEALVKVFDRDPVSGAPLMGHQPFALGVEDMGSNKTRVYVGAFDTSYVTPIDVDLTAPGTASYVKLDPNDKSPNAAPRRIGEVRQ